VVVPLDDDVRPGVVDVRLGVDEGRLVRELLGRDCDRLGRWELDREGRGLERGLERGLALRVGAERLGVLRLRPR